VVGGLITASKLGEEMQQSTQRTAQIMSKEHACHMQCFKFCVIPFSSLISHTEVANDTLKQLTSKLPKKKEKHKRGERHKSEFFTEFSHYI
jgi:hypothetical protein